MREDIWYESKGMGQIHGCKWVPEGEVKGIVQIVHGIAEYVLRYEDFARYLNGLGYLVVGEDHMGHGLSISGGSTQGYFHGGWYTACADTVQLMEDTMEEYPGVPYVLFGHSMGSFMARTILCKYPDCGLSGAIICGSGWMPTVALPGIKKVMEAVCKKTGEEQPSEKLWTMVFGNYNAKVEHPRTAYDWLTRDSKQVDAYIADPLCGFVAACGLLRDMMGGFLYNQDKASLGKMNKDLPVFFIAGGDDPVGNYGKGVRQAAEAFRTAGMKRVSTRIYPLCRHEILNEINKDETYEDVAQWLEKTLEKKD